MNKKTINSVICKKFDEFVLSIKDDKVKELVKKNTLITGGCIASMLQGENVNDYDMYFTDKETTKAVSDYYVKLFNETNKGSQKGSVREEEGGRIRIFFQSNGVAKEEGYQIENIDTLEGAVETSDTAKPKYRPVYLSSNAITLSDQVQLVIRFYGPANEIHDNYDYVHCTNYWRSKDRQVVLNQPALEAILSKELRYIGSKYPLASIIRSRKFITRGWHINAGQYLKMAFQVHLLDLTDLAVLEDQLVGVDTAYFNMLIDALQEAKETHKDDEQPFEITYGYISTIIDRLF